jgi:hypothetical protein
MRNEMRFSSLLDLPEQVTDVTKHGCNSGSSLLYYTCSIQNVPFGSFILENVVHSQRH